MLDEKDWKCKSWEREKEENRAKMRVSNVEA